MDKWKKTEKEAQDKIDEDAKHLEKFATKQNLLEQKVAESLEKIHQLGALPADELCAQYHRYSSRAVSIKNNKNKIVYGIIFFIVV